MPAVHTIIIDIVERFTLSLMLLIVALRNLIELSGSAFDLGEGSILPRSFGWFGGKSVIWTIFYVSECGTAIRWRRLTMSSQW